MTLNELMKNKSNNFIKTLLFTCLLSLGCIFIAFMIQYLANRAVGSSCSYLDPIAVDIWAMVFAVFLILEGGWDISRYPDYPFKSQFTKSIRVGLGFAILTIHIMQFIHK